MTDLEKYGIKPVMEDVLMLLVLIGAVFIGLAALIIHIRQRFFSNQPAKPPEEVDLFNDPITRAVSGETHDPNEQTIPLYKLSNMAEAATLKTLLEENGIACMIQSFHDAAYDGLWQHQKGWGILKVFEKDQFKAEELIQSFLKTGKQETSDFEESTPIPAGRPLFSKIIFAGSLIILLAALIIGVIAFLSAYRNSGRELAMEGYYHSIYNENDQAIECYNKAIARSYKESWVYNNRGYVMYKKGDLDNAIKDYDKAIELDPKDDQAYANRGCAKCDKGDYAGALMDFERDIEIHPRSSLSWSNKSHALNNLDKYQDALKASDKAIELDHKWTYAWDNKGYALGKLGRHEEAFEALDKAMKLSPKDAWAWYNRACVYSFKNDRQKVLDDLRQAISLDVQLKKDAKNDKDFQWLWADAEFKELTEENADPAKERK